MVDLFRALHVNYIPLHMKAYLHIEGDFTKMSENYSLALNHMMGQLASVIGASTAEIWDAYAYAGKYIA